MTALTGRRPTAIEDRLDHLTAQVDELVAEMRRQRESRRAVGRAVHELAPGGPRRDGRRQPRAQELSRDVTIDDVTRVRPHHWRLAAQAAAMLVQLDSMAELTHEVNSITGAGMAKLSESLADAERKGYFTFARHGAEMVEEVVTSFGEDDVVALRETTCSILTTVKELTQPEVMTLLNRTVSPCSRGRGRRT
jgi:hypothetical protein